MDLPPAKGGSSDGPRLMPLITRSQFRDVLGMLWRHRSVILGSVILVTGLVTLVLFQLTPRYRAESLVLIAPPKARVLDQTKSIITGLPWDQDRINSEIAVITARQLVERLVKKADLVKDPEFNVKLREKRGIVGWVRSRLLSSDSSLAGRTREEQERIQMAKVVAELQKHISVSARFQSRVIAISVTSTDAEKSSELTNQLVELYMVEQLEAKFEALQRASKWLGSRIATLRAAVDRSERAVAAYRQKYGLIEGKDKETGAASRITNLNSQLVIARVKRAEAEARLEALKKAIKSRGGVGSIAAVQSSSLIQQLRVRESLVIGKLAELNAEYGRKHPKIIAARAELADLRSKIRQEVLKIVARVRNEVLVARASERTLEESLEAVQASAAKVNKASVGLRVLEREAEANRALLKALLARLKETSSQGAIQSADARVISRAVIPTTPYFPKEVLLITVAFGISLVIGVSLAVALEHLDSGFRSADQIEHLTSYSAIGLVPSLEGKFSKKKGGIATYLDQNPLSQYAEAIRNVHVSLALSNVDNPPRLILVTSAMSGEGKSTTAYAIARAAASAGKKAILVDCDMRNPTAHALVDLDQRPGLVDILSAKSSLEETIRSGHVANLSILPAGDHPPNPSDLLLSERMKWLTGQLKEKYDLIVLDSPPVMAVSDPRVLAPQADAVLFLVRWAKTKRENVVHAIKQLAEDGARIAGVVVTQVNVKKHAEYEYGDSGYYRSGGKYYYTS
jgi:succinoglycan biosynthesis transport protein ExoP